MKTYQKYKSSGIEWIGDIPEHWEAKKLKFIGQSMIGIIYSPDDVSADEEGLLVLRSSNIQNGVLDYKDCVYVNKTVDSKYLTKSGDILICARNGSADLVGKCALIDEKAANLTFGAFMSIVRSDYGKLLYYFFSSEIFKSQKGLFSTSTINQLTSGTLNNLFVAIPSDKDEQTAIADYLDEKTAEIDKLIANKKRLIELLKEERTAIINKAVTKGIKSDAKLKPSGIDWLGDIPEHWEVKRFKFVAKIKYGLGQPPNQKDDGLPLIRATNVERGRIVEKDLIFVDPEDIPYDRDPILKENDIIIVRSGAYTADSAIIPKKYDGAIAGYDMVARVYEDSPVFISYCLLSNYVLINQLYLERLRAAQPHLNKEELGETLILLPKIEEQKEIVEFIESKTNEIDSTISKIEKEIELIKEYRTALISEVVTGKMKVM